MKKFAFMLVLAVLLCMAFSVCAETTDGMTITDGVLTKYSGTATDVVIPSTVTEIGAQAFNNNKTLKSITVHSGVTKISTFAFYGCSALESVSLSDGLLEIGNSAFRDCTALSSITIPGSVTTFGTYVFYNAGLTEAVISEGVTVLGDDMFFLCENLQKVVLPDSLTDVNGAFTFCNMLLYASRSSYVYRWADENGYACFPTEETPVISNGFVSAGTKLYKYFGSDAVVHLPSGVTEIGAAAFETLSTNYNIRQIVLPVGITTIGQRAFWRSAALIQLPSTVTSIHKDAFATLSNKASTYLIVLEDTVAHAFVQADSRLTYSVLEEGVMRQGDFIVQNGTALRYVGDAASVTVPSGVTALGAELFKYNATLQSVSLPSDLLTIGDNAFYGCTALSTCEIPSTVTSIGKMAFSSCKELTSITIPQGLTSLGENAFQACSGLTAVSIPSGMTSVPEQIFAQCTSLASVTLPNGLESIGRGAFAQCFALEKITLPSTVRSIGKDAFMGCTSLSSFSIPSGVEAIEEWTFNGCEALTSISIPASVRSIGQSAFEYCTALTSIALPEGLETIADYAFGNCEKLTSISIPSTVSAIGRSAFEYCTALSGTVIIPEGVTEIADYTFTSCDKLTGIVLPYTLKTIGDYAFYASCKKDLYLPDNITSVGDSFVYGYESYGTTLHCADNTNTASTLTKAGFSYVSTLSQNGVLTMQTVQTQSGEFKQVVFDCDSTATSAVIPDGTIGIRYNAFMECTQLTGVTIPSSVQSIGEGAFRGCWKLDNVVIPSGITAIGPNMFAACTALKSISIPASVTAIEANAFSSCTSLASISIPAAVTDIQEGAFEGCRSLASLVLPSGLKTLGVSALYNCGFSELDLPENITSLGSTFVSGGVKLYVSTESLTGETLTAAGWAYGERPYTSGVLTLQKTVETDGTQNLRVTACDASAKIVTVPDGVTFINANVFRGMQDLAQIILPDSLHTIYAYAFAQCPALRYVALPDGVTDVGSMIVTAPTLAGCREGSATETALLGAGQTYQYFHRTEGMVIRPGTEGDTVLECDPSVTSVTVPASVTAIADAAFAGCTQLARIEIPLTVTMIGTDVFQNCPDTLVVRCHAQSAAAQYAESQYILTDLEKHTEEILPAVPGSSCTELGLSEGKWCPVCGKTLVEQKPEYGSQHQPALTEYTLATAEADGLRGAVVCADCSQTLKESKTVESAKVLHQPSALTTLCESAYEGVAAQQVSLPDGVSSIPARAFAGCENLCLIVLPKTISFIAEDAFEGSADAAFVCSPDHTYAIEWAAEHLIPAAVN